MDSSCSLSSAVAAALGAGAGASTGPPPASAPLAAAAGSKRKMDCSGLAEQAPDGKRAKQDGGPSSPMQAACDEAQQLQAAQAEQTQASPTTALRPAAVSASEATEEPRPTGPQIPAAASLPLLPPKQPAEPPAAAPAPAPTNTAAGPPPSMPLCSLELEVPEMEEPEEWSAEQARRDPLLRQVVFHAAGDKVVGDYQLASMSIGDGGLGAVYEAIHQGTNARVALKLGTKEFVPELGEVDFTWWTFVTEWTTYRALDLGQGHAWMPTAYECGLLATGEGNVPWLTMELLGPSLHTLSKQNQSPAALGACAHGMLTAAESLHRAGFLHRDIKPANFVTQHGFELASGAAPQIVLLDYGFAYPWHPHTAHGRLQFCGTPDFASIASLRGFMPGPADDLEAVGYTLLQLVLGRAPWDITQSPQTQEAKLVGEQQHLVLEARTRQGTPPPPSPPGASEEPSWRSSAGWTDAQLGRMADRKEAVWGRMVKSGEIPAWLERWVALCRSTPPNMLPDYRALHDLIDRGCGLGSYAQQVVAAAAPKPQAPLALPFRALAAEE